jgi:endo-1,4-beta-xylanase
MLVSLLAFGLIFAGCDNGTTPEDPPPPFVAVTSISGVPTGGVKNTPVTLSGIVNPNNATNKTITWAVKSAGTTNATITDGNKLNTTAAGIAVVTATIANGLTASSNYIQDFNITITDEFVAVTSISGVPTSGTAGTALTLTGTVTPANATNKTITWSVKSGTATISGNSLTASAAGTVVVTATIANGSTVSSNYTQDFNITISAGGGGGDDDDDDDDDFVAVNSISDVITTGEIGTLTLSGMVNPNNATNKTIIWTMKSPGTTGAVISGNTLTTTAVGTVTVTAIIINGLAANSNYTQDFNITIPFVPVDSITEGPPTTGKVGTALALTGTVNPANATNKTIVWTVVGTDIATISGDMLTATGIGAVTVTATIVNGLTESSNYTQFFHITIPPE